MTARWGSPSLISRVHVTKARSCDWQRWNMSTISWITDYLTGRLQYVRLSVLLMGSTCHLQKYSDCGVDGSISDEQEKEYRAQVDDFVESSGRNHLLQIRGGDGVWLQNKETCPTTNTGQDVDVVDEYLTTRGWIWRLTQRLWKKSGWAASFSHETEILQCVLKVFYHSVVVSTLYFAVFCRGKQHLSWRHQQTG